MQQAVIEVMCNIVERRMIIYPSVDKSSTLQKSPNLDMLPDEILVKVFSYVSLPDLALRVCSLGNRRLRNICQDPKLCKSVTVDRMWNEDTVMAVLSMVGRNMQELTIAVKRNDLYSKLRKVIAYYSNFNVASRPAPLFTQRKYLCDEVVSDAMLSNILSVIRECGDKITLRKLILRTERRSGKPKFCPISATLFAHASSSLKNLSMINVRFAKFGKESSDCVTAIADYCLNLEHAQLPLMHNLTDQLFTYFLEHLQGRLKYLALYPYKITDDAFCALKTCQHLEVLIIKHARHIGPEGLKIILELPKLQQLYISSAKVLTGADFVEVLKHMQVPEMVCLELYDTPALVNDNTLEMISMSCPNLLGLFLYGNGEISEIGIKNVLGRCKKIAFVYIGNLFGKAPPTIKAFYCHYDSKIFPDCCYCSRVVTCEARKKVQPSSKKGYKRVQKYFRHSEVMI